MATRTTDAEMAEAARQAVTDCLRAADATVVAHPDADIVSARLPNGQRLDLRLHPAAVVDQGVAASIASRRDDRPTIVVGDLIGADARRVLDAAGISWLDRRGHLRVNRPDIWIDREVRPRPRVRRSSGPALEIRGAAAMAVAAGHLVDPDRFGGVRPLARLLGLSPAAISQARTPLNERGLLVDNPEARVELFWALARAWRPAWVELSEVPAPADGLLAAGTRAAAALGAPIIATADYPVELSCDDAVLLERLRLRLGPVDRTGSTVSRLAVAPTALVHLVGPTDRAVDGHPVAHPLFVALDLAADPARGAEALADWSPEDWPRAW